MSGLDHYYLSMTSYYQFGIDDITKIPNSLAFYLTGEETYIKQLDVMLDIGYEQDKSQAKRKFIEILQQTFNILEIPLSDDLISSLSEDKWFEHEYETHQVSLSYDNFERVEKYTLSIVTK